MSMTSPFALLRPWAVVPALLLIAACKPEATAPAPPPSAATEPKEVEIKVETTRPAATVEPAKLNAQGLPDMDFIYNTSRRFFVEQKRFARDLEELVAMGYMPKLPTPPPGKKYVINQRSATISLVDSSTP